MGNRYPIRESELLCNLQSVSQAVLALSPSGTYGQILVVVKTVVVLYLKPAAQVLPLGPMGFLLLLRYT
jgi:hypothetical protein